MKRSNKSNEQLEGGEDASSDSRGLRFDEREKDANYMSCGRGTANKPT